jgi:hypothetical protein
LYEDDLVLILLLLMGVVLILHLMYDVVDKMIGGDVGMMMLDVYG